MCFSAEASFTASAVLLVMGAAALKMRKRPELNYLAMVPIFFGLQQASEGLLWLQLPTDPHSHLAKSAQYSFLMFAFLIWPIWIPISVLMAEKVQWKKRAVGAILAVGIALSLYHLYDALKSELGVQIIGHSIHYTMSRPFELNYWILEIVYGLIILLPCFISSLRGMWVFGTLIVASWLLTAAVWETTFTSVWCFFSAIISLYLYKVIRDNREVVYR